MSFNFSILINIFTTTLQDSCYYMTLRTPDIEFCSYHSNCIKMSFNCFLIIRILLLRILLLVRLSLGLAEQVLARNVVLEGKVLSG